MRKQIRKRIAYNLIHSSHRAKSLTESELKRQYPVSRGVDGWYFRVTRLGTENYIVEARDVAGRELMQKGTSQEHLLVELAAQAKEVLRQLDSANKKRAT